MKKIVSSIFAVLLFSILTILPSRVLAQDYWVYSDGKIDYYVMTDTVDKQYDSYNLKVKYVHKKYAPEYRTLSVEYRAMKRGRLAWKYKVWDANGSNYESIEQNHWSGAVWKYLIDNYEADWQ